MPGSPPQLQQLISEYEQLRDLASRTPQSRGQRFNGLIAEVLRSWGVTAEEDQRGAGEIDVLFTADGVHYVLEAKWLRKKADTGAVAKLQKRVRQRLAGTCGVFLSLSGYSGEALADIKDGERLEVLLLDRSHWEEMLYGRMPPAQLLTLARRSAAHRGQAYTPLPELRTLADGEAPPVAGPPVPSASWPAAPGDRRAAGDGARVLPQALRVFVSHTSELRDFPAGGSYVAAAERAVSACGNVIVNMADFPADARPPAELCEDRVRSCDVYVGVLGMRYGSRVPGRDFSYTELEFDTAGEHGIPRLVFLLDADAVDTGIPASRLADPRSGERQEALRRRASGDSGLTVQQFRNPAQLGQLVERSLRDLSRSAGGQGAGGLPTAAGAARQPGWPLGKVRDPFALEVHQPVRAEDAPPGLPQLPVYLPREHDRALGEMVRAAAGGRSVIAVLVGGSSTGKTRACWEALDLLRGQPESWRLWHPIDPGRPEAALRELPGVGPRTVVWLNEAQFYLQGGGTGEQVAAGLRELLRDQARGPVLILATLWPEYWDELTRRPAASVPDPHAQARELLSGHSITVPAALTGADLKAAAATGDPRLAQATKAAEGGRVIQFLAGAPELVSRYENAPAAERALLDAAVDARRLGMGAGLPRAFLDAAAPGYLSEADWDQLGGNWLDEALNWTAQPRKGIRGPLAPHGPRPGDPPGRTAFRLADYLEQHGRRIRRACFPPDRFWKAAAGHADPRDLTALAWAAESRGLLRDAALLRKIATEHGDTRAAGFLVWRWRFTHPDATDPRPAQWAAIHCALDDPGAVIQLLRELSSAGAKEQGAVLATRAAAHAPLDSDDVAELLTELRVEGAMEQATALLGRDPAAHVALDNLKAVAWLLAELHALAELPVSGAAEQVTALLGRDPAAHVALDDPGGVAVLLRELRVEGAMEQATALLARDPAAHVALDNLVGVIELLRELHVSGAMEQAAALASRAAVHAPLSEPFFVNRLLDELRLAGMGKQVAALADHIAVHVPLDDLDPGIIRLLEHVQKAGMGRQAAALADRAAAGAPLDDPRAVTWLLRALRKAGMGKQAAALADRAAANAALADEEATGRLLDALQKAGTGEEAATLLASDPVTRAALADPQAIEQLLSTLQKADAKEQAAALADHVAAHAPLNDLARVTGLLAALRNACMGKQAVTLADRAAAHAPLDSDGAAWVLNALRALGAEEASRTLLTRMPAEGSFKSFLREPGHEMQYRFGREVDGSPARPWGWDDLRGARY